MQAYYEQLFQYVDVQIVQSNYVVMIDSKINVFRYVVYKTRIFLAESYGTFRLLLRRRLRLQNYSLSNKHM